MLVLLTAATLLEPVAGFQLFTELFSSMPYSDSLLEHFVYMAADEVDVPFVS